MDAVNVGEAYEVRRLWRYILNGDSAESDQARGAMAELVERARQVLGDDGPSGADVRQAWSLNCVEQHADCLDESDFTYPPRRSYREAMGMDRLSEVGRNALGD